MRVSVFGHAPSSLRHVFSAMDPFKVFVKCESNETPSECASDDGGGGSGGAGSKANRRGVGRLVDSTQADDRRMIALVRARPLLYARSNLPVASYHSQVKKLWREVADIMRWTVADVRRKWSHIRNSYSRHLRNEIHGIRTGRGRMVSKWYLADELEYLREHMATDTRPCPLSLVASGSSFASSTVKWEDPTQAATHYLMEEAGGPVPEPVEPAVEVRTERLLPAPSTPALADHDASSSYEPEEPDSYFQFFRGIYKDYQELCPQRQRRFRRQCLVFLHQLVDGEGEEGEYAAVNLSANQLHYSSDSGGESALPH